MNLQQFSEQKLLFPAVLTEEDEFYAECDRNEINFVDRINAKPLWVYPYWISRPNCNWKAPKQDCELDD